MNMTTNNKILIKTELWLVIIRKCLILEQVNEQY